MLLEGSCHCGAVRFNVESTTPYPYMRCYCSICRKTAGGGGYAINIMGYAKSLEVQGEEHVQVYQALVPDGQEEGKLKPSDARRHFCKQCGSALYLYDPTWAEWVYPFASAIDTPLPKPPETANIMLAFGAPWVSVPRGPRDTHFQGYPDEAILDWHTRHELNTL
jgi:hypothetical protein